ncbi:hypothetical protein D3C80_1498290 [compost metagenome]
MQVAELVTLTDIDSKRCSISFNRAWVMSLRKAAYRIRPGKVIFEMDMAPQRSSPSWRAMRTSRLTPTILLTPVSRFALT